MPGFEGILADADAIPESPLRDAARALSQMASDIWLNLKYSPIPGDKPFAWAESRHTRTPIFYSRMADPSAGGLFLHADKPADIFRKVAEKSPDKSTEALQMYERFHHMMQNDPRYQTPGTILINYPPSENQHSREVIHESTHALLQPYLQRFAETRPMPSQESTIRETLRQAGQPVDIPTEGLYNEGLAYASTGEGISFRPLEFVSKSLSVLPSEVRNRYLSMMKLSSMADLLNQQEADPQRKRDAALNAIMKGR